ncbi:MAG TPA: glucosaminidase domain-containing protein [Treponema sp.]|nr:glucosaminidase domain-containing protein [Treponema sp.]
MGSGNIDSKGLVAFFMESNSDADESKVCRLAGYYREEAAIEGVNSDVAFVQMCLETGFLRFGGLVTEDMNNFCGLGSIGPGQPGLSFPSERIGVRAHVQHLQAYGSSDLLVQELVDSRYRYVSPRGKAPFIGALGGTWAADRQYGEKLAMLLSRLYRY